MNKSRFKCVLTLFMGVSLFAGKISAQIIDGKTTPLSPCQCLFKSKHYTWDHSQVPLEKREELYQFKYHGWIDVKTSSRFRCVYQCADEVGNLENVEYTHYEIQNGYLTGGMSVAKLFNCAYAIPGFKRQFDYYIPLPSLPFYPAKSSVGSLKEWGAEKNCGRSEIR